MAKARISEIEVQSNREYFDFILKVKDVPIKHLEKWKSFIGKSGDEKEIDL